MCVFGEPGKESVYGCSQSVRFAEGGEGCVSLVLGGFFGGERESVCMRDCVFFSEQLWLIFCGST